MAAESARVIRKLLDSGYEAYWVGGCVRDEYSGRPVSDMDITTSARPEAVVSLFDRVIPTGMQHGTVTVLMEQHSFEVTTFRVEEGYEDHRRPTEVMFVAEIEKDLRRRDFTMNAMALSLEGHWVDPFGGREDIERGLIRCVGDARHRFQEDALRMIRCVRFASVFGFQIEDETWQALLEQRDTLAWIAMERIRAEMDKMMAGPDPMKGLSLLLESELYDRLRAPFPYRGHRQNIMEALALVPAEEADLRYALLLYACGISPDEADGLLRAWTFSNARRDLIRGLLAFQERWDSEISSVPEQEAGQEGGMASRLAWTAMVLERGPETAVKWLQMQEAISLSGSGDNKDMLFRVREWLENMKIKELKDLHITGSELLLETGRRGGPWLGGVLKHLLLHAAAGRLPNDKASLIDEARRVISDEIE